MRTVHGNNVTRDLIMQKFLEATKDGMALVTKEEFCRHTETVKTQYWERGGIVSEVTDRIVINLSPGSDSDSDTTAMTTLTVTVA
jgi:hypothetical protein